MTVYLDLDKNNFITGWGTSEDCGIATDLDVNDTRLLRCFSYQYIDGELIYNDEKMLNERKKERLDELTEECNRRIIEGFIFELDGIDYKFGFSMSDQANLTSTAIAINMGIKDEVVWTVERNDRKESIILDKENFTSMYKQALKHKEDNIKYLRNKLQPLVEKAETIDELNKIMWGV